MQIVHLSTRVEVGTMSRISITSTITKILKETVNTTIMKYFIENKLLTDRQHGISSGHKLRQILLMLNDCITEFLHHNTLVNMIFLDLAKTLYKV